MKTFQELKAYYEAIYWTDEASELAPCGTCNKRQAAFNAMMAALPSKPGEKPVTHRDI